ncbi:MAG: molybdopterin molybdotransferase [Flavobacteriaceae bacterium]|jgi:molybdopterin molybdotransferase
MARLMTSVKDALQIINDKISHLAPLEVGLLDALDLTLAEEISSPIHMPPFDQSAMDGYAICKHSEKEYRLIGEVKAGDQPQILLQPGESTRIFTGAMVPRGANSVVKQEDVTRIDSSIIIHCEPKAGMNIRPAGEQIKKSEIALSKGSRLNPGAIGFLAMLGITKVTVYRKPSISVIATGSELVKPGNELTGGEIFESNTYTLQAALKKSGFSCEISSVEDDYAATKKSVRAALDKSDVVIVTGGISVGDYDFVGLVLGDLNVQTGFYKVKQKPGKPLFFGTAGSKLVFALPGNPAAVLSCFYIYVLPALKLLIGNQVEPKPIESIILADSYSKSANLTHFLKARAENGKVKLLSSQSSAMLNSFVDSNCLAVMQEDKTEWKAGDLVDVIMI